MGRGTLAGEGENVLRGVGGGSQGEELEERNDKEENFLTNKMREGG